MKEPQHKNLVNKFVILSFPFLFPPRNSIQLGEVFSIYGIANLPKWLVLCAKAQFFPITYQQIPSYEPRLQQCGEEEGFCK
jgi:hypothetical protein